MKGDQCPYLHEKQPILPSHKPPHESLEGKEGDMHEEYQQLDQQSFPQRNENDCKRKAENILMKHSFKKSLQNNFHVESLESDQGKMGHEKRGSKRKEELDSLEGIIYLSSPPVARGNSSQSGLERTNEDNERSECNLVSASFSHQPEVSAYEPFLKS